MATGYRACNSSNAFAADLTSERVRFRLSSTAMSMQFRIGICEVKSDEAGTPMSLKAAACFIGAYCTAALALCGDITAPIDFLVFPRPGLWQILLLVSGLLAGVAVSPTVSPRLPVYLRPALFVAVWMVLTVSSVGLYADWQRRTAISKFQPDSELQHSFFRSIREVPREFQFYVHAAALKGCIPYIWSYRSMSLVQLDPDVAPNVLPLEWIARCDLKRTR